MSLSSEENVCSSQSGTSIETLWKGMSQFLIVSYLLSILMIAVLKVVDQFLPFCLYDDGRFFFYYMMALFFFSRIMTLCEPENYTFYLDSFDFLRFCISFGIVLEFEALAQLYINYIDVSFFLERDTHAAWKLYWLFAMGLIRIPTLSIYLYLSHKIHDYGKEKRGKHWLLFFADVAVTQFFFLYIYQNNFLFLPTWFASLLSYYYYTFSRMIFQ